jgi:hypothetical protein
MYRKVIDIAIILSVIAIIMMGVWMSIDKETKTLNEYVTYTDEAMLETDSILELASQEIMVKKHKEDSIHNLLKVDQKRINHLDLVVKSKITDVDKLYFQIDSIKKHYTDSIDLLIEIHCNKVNFMEMEFESKLDQYQLEVEKLWDVIRIKETNEQFLEQVKEDSLEVLMVDEKPIISKKKMRFIIK